MSFRRRAPVAVAERDPHRTVSESVGDRLALLVLVQEADKVVHAWEETGVSNALAPELERLRSALRVIGERV